MNLLLRLVLTFWFFVSFHTAFGSDTIVVIPLRKEINPSATRLISKGILKAKELKAKLIIIDMNTYGGLVNDADSIRTSILNTNIPVWVYINKNAASAGALISLACDSIFMQPGSNIGAATAVTQDGEAAPDKYQSYMRGLMRSTAEAQGKNKNGDFRRNPKIAEAMVDEDIAIAGITKKGEVITLTPSEALELGYCDQTFNTFNDLLKENDLLEAAIVRTSESTLDKIVGWLLNPAVRGILITGIILGLYFEIQTPGLGIPSAAALLAGILYFAPAYLDGFAENWEVVIFVIGLILIAVELLVIPGFGLAGILGIILAFAGLVLAMVRNINFDFGLVGMTDIFTSLATVVIIFIGFMAYLLLQSSERFKKPMFHRLVHNNNLEGISTIKESINFSKQIGMTVVVHKTCRPTGQVKINDKLYNARSISGVKNIGESVKIVGHEQNEFIIR
jgi:membrane-bound serine protease (ClpP class)